MLRRIWYVWAKSLGAKPENLSNREADFTAAIRTVWVLTHLITCGFIIANSGRTLLMW